MSGPRRFWLVAALALALLGRTGLPSHAQPADESAEAMNARLAGATVNRVGPSYLYPDHATTPGVVNPDITQANIQQTICTRGWTATVRPPASYIGPPQAAACRGPGDRSKPRSLRRGLLHLTGARRTPPRRPEPVARALGHARASAHVPRSVPVAPRRGQGQGHDRERAQPGGLPIRDRRLMREAHLCLRRIE
jgi:hypothetical protein